MASPDTKDGIVKSSRTRFPMDCVKLIEEIRERTAIWDQKDKQYHNRDVSNEKWLEVSDIMGQPSKYFKIQA